MSFKSGAWEGFYMQNGKKIPLVIHVDFHRSSGTIEGHGTHEVLGFFSIQGSYSEKAPYPVDFIFSFTLDPSAKMEFNGWRESDKGGVFGTWKGGSLGSGSYAFHPSKEAAGNSSYHLHSIPKEAEKRLQEEALKKNKESLKNMGFPEWLIDQALKEVKGLEAAVNWITNKLDKPEPSGEAREEVDEEKVVSLVSMGFDDDLARKALRATGGNLEAATDWILNHM